MSDSWQREDPFDDDEDPFDDEDLLGDADEHGDTEHGFPVIGYRDGEPIPALALIPQDRWYEVLAPLRRMTRRAAVDGVSYEDISTALALLGELEIADAGPKSAALDAPPPALPAGAAPRPGGPSHQINFRVGPVQYERLVRAADIYGLRPATLARAMTVSGVDRALYEQRRAREQERPR